MNKTHKKRDTARDNSENFMRNYHNLEALGVPIKTSKKIKEPFEDITTIFSSMVCNVGDKQVERYKSGKSKPHMDRWGKIYQELLQKGKLIRCDPDVKRDILVAAGSALYHDPSFSLDDCRECKMCGYAKSCRNDSVLYPQCKLALAFLKFADASTNLSLNFDSTIADIRSRKSFLTDSIAAQVDAIYQSLEKSIDKDMPEINKAHLNVLLKNASLLMKTSRYLWMFLMFDESAVEDTIEYCERLSPKKTIAQIYSNREMVENLLTFAKELDEVAPKADMIKVRDIAKMESFNNLTFWEACFVISNLSVLVCFKLRPVDVRLYAILMQFFPEEEIQHIFDQTVSRLKNA